MRSMAAGKITKKSAPKLRTAVLNQRGDRLSNTSNLVQQVTGEVGVLEVVERVASVAGVLAFEF